MVNDENRRSHEFQDEPRGKPNWGGVHVSERLSSTNLGKTSRGQPRPKPESGNPTFRECVQQKLVCSRRRQHGASQNWPTRRDTLAGLERQHDDKDALSNCETRRFPSKPRIGRGDVGGDSLRKSQRGIHLSGLIERESSVAAVMTCGSRMKS